MLHGHSLRPDIEALRLPIASIPMPLREAGCHGGNAVLSNPPQKVPAGLW
jgi:hypothetical protein